MGRKEVIGRIHAPACKTKVLKEKTMRGMLLYSPGVMNAAFKAGLEERGWSERRSTLWVTSDDKGALWHSWPPRSRAKTSDLRMLATHPIVVAFLVGNEPLPVQLKNAKDGGVKFLTDNVVESPGLPNCIAAQPTSYQLKTTTIPRIITSAARKEREHSYGSRRGWREHSNHNLSTRVYADGTEWRWWQFRVGFRRWIRKTRR